MIIKRRDKKRFYFIRRRLNEDFTWIKIILGRQQDCEEFINDLFHRIYSALNQRGQITMDLFFKFNFR